MDGLLSLLLPHERADLLPSHLSVLRAIARERPLQLVFGPP